LERGAVAATADHKALFSGVGLGDYQRMVTPLSVLGDVNTLRSGCD
jgi:hypothetical protein